MDLYDIKITKLGTQYNVSSLEAGCSGQAKTLEVAVGTFALAYHEGRMRDEENTQKMKQIILRCITHAIEKRKSSGKTLDELDELYASMAEQAVEGIQDMIY